MTPDQQRELDIAQVLAGSLFAAAIDAPDDRLTLQLALAAQEALSDLRAKAYAGRTWTDDGGEADRTSWCQCEATATQVQYEAYDIAGQRTAHGFLCATCRRITQTG